MANLISEVSWLGLYFVIVRSFIKSITSGNVRIEVVIGFTTYGLFLVCLRFARSVVNVILHIIIGIKHGGARLRRSRQTRPQEPDKTIDFSAYYRLGGLQVILGKDGYRRNIKVDLRFPHTLIGGNTGSGKTVLVNSFLIQLFSKGNEFTESYDVVFLDLKGNEFKVWKALCSMYRDIDDFGMEYEPVLQVLEDLATNIYRKSGKKDTLLIIDEIATITENAPNSQIRRRAEVAINRIAMQLRQRGALIITTQRPHYKALPRSITGNLDRKICLRVDGFDSADLVLRRRPQINPRDFNDGEFILSEPGKKREEIYGRSILPDLPGEIDQVVSRNIDLASENDPRIQVFMESQNGDGQLLKGIIRVSKVVNLSAEDVKLHRRNYAFAGICEAQTNSKGGVSGYKLVMDPDIAVGILRKYIGEGKWRSAPEKINES